MDLREYRPGVEPKPEPEPESEFARHKETGDEPTNGAPGSALTGTANDGSGSGSGSMQRCREKKPLMPPLAVNPHLSPSLSLSLSLWI